MGKARPHADLFSEVMISSTFDQTTQRRSTLACNGTIAARPSPRSLADLRGTRLKTHPDKRGSQHSVVL